MVASRKAATRRSAASPRAHRQQRPAELGGGEAQQQLAAGARRPLDDQQAVAGAEGGDRGGKIGGGTLAGGPLGRVQRRHRAQLGVEPSPLDQMVDHAGLQADALGQRHPVVGPVEQHHAQPTQRAAGGEVSVHERRGLQLAGGAGAVDRLERQVDGHRELRLVAAEVRHEARRPGVGLAGEQDGQQVALGGGEVEQAGDAAERASLGPQHRLGADPGGRPVGRGGPALHQALDVVGAQEGGEHAVGVAGQQALVPAPADGGADQHPGTGQRQVGGGRAGGRPCGGQRWQGGDGRSVGH